jgi:NADPH2:quinone reductase
MRAEITLIGLSKFLGPLLSRPVLFHYTAEHLQEMAGNVFRALREGTLRVEVKHRYPLGAAADAHRDLEARRTSGQIVLLP